jgi:hypothetical protein
MIERVASNGEEDNTRKSLLSKLSKEITSDIDGGDLSPFGKITLSKKESKSGESFMMKKLTNSMIPEVRSDPNPCPLVQSKTSIEPVPVFFSVLRIKETQDDALTIALACMNS